MIKIFLLLSAVRLAVCIYLMCFLPLTAYSQVTNRDRDGIVDLVKDIRKKGCSGNLSVSSLSPVETLNSAADKLVSGLDLSSSLLRSEYRSFKSQAIQLGGHKSLSSLRAALVSRYCLTIIDSSYSEFGVGGTISSAAIILARPFIREIQDRKATSAQIVNLVNEARLRGAVCGQDQFISTNLLVANDKLNTVAQFHAVDMATHNYYSHNSKDGKSPSDRMRDGGYVSSITGENIASGQQDAQEVVAGWLRSPGHCRNIMNPLFREIGIGVSVNLKSDRGIYWVQKFGGGEK